MDDDCDNAIDVDFVDRDGDGRVGDEDCNDEDGWVHAFAAEACDGLDNNCNGDVDEGCSASVAAPAKSGGCSTGGSYGSGAVWAVLLAAVNSLRPGAPRGARRVRTKAATRANQPAP